MSRSPSPGPPGPPGDRAGVEGHAVELGLALRDLREGELAHRFELLGHPLLTHGRPESDLGRAQRLPGVARVALEGEALHLDAEELEARDVALLRPELVDALELVQGGQVLRGQRHRFACHEDVRERLLHLEDDLAPEVDELVAGDLGGRFRAVDASLPLAPSSMGWPTLNVY
jgi:hypothetical protein